MKVYHLKLVYPSFHLITTKKSNSCFKTIYFLHKKADILIKSQIWATHKEILQCYNISHSKRKLLTFSPFLPQFWLKMLQGSNESGGSKPKECQWKIILNLWRWLGMRVKPNLLSSISTCPTVTTASNLCPSGTKLSTLWPKHTGIRSSLSRLMVRGMMWQLRNTMCDPFQLLWSYSQELREKILCAGKPRANERTEPWKSGS